MALTVKDQELLVSELETALDRLQALYNQYFMGIEKLEPTIPHKDVNRRIQALRKEKIHNTAIRFRFQTQVQKYSTQSNYWRRICRQIEEGTYHRDVMRAKKRSARRDEGEIASMALSELGAGYSEAPPPAVDLSEEMGMDLDDPFAAPTSTRADHTTAPPPPGESFAQPLHATPAPSDPDKTPVPMAGSGIHKLHERLISEARKSVTENEEDVLSGFFAPRRSIPPPPPKPEPAPRKAPKSKPAPRKAPKSKPAPRKAPKSKPAPRKAPKSKPASRLDDERMKAIYRAYVFARKKTSESTDKINFAKVSKLLKKQMAEKGAVDFKVVIRKGKAVIKTVKE
jgi:hypothetical protein